MKIVAISALILFNVLAFPARAQSDAGNYPSKPVRLIVGFSPGGLTDILARMVARELQKSMGQPIVVENKPSTGAIVGAVATAKADPDGYTLMLGASGPMVFNPAVYSNLPYSPQKDFIPVSLIAKFPLILATKHGSKINSIKDLVEYTRSNPDLSNYSASSASFQLASEMFKGQSGAVGEYIPYKGSNDAIMAVASGEVTFTMADPGPAAGAIKGNLIKGLAITSEERMPLHPSIPTLKEEGIDLQIGLWLGLFAPAGTPAAIIEKLEKETAKVIAMPEVSKDMARLGVVPASSSSAELADLMANEIETWAALAKQKNIKVE